MTASLSDELFDIVIVGTGVVGCAMARRFALEGARVLIVEKSGDTLDGASKANSAILHTGFDAPPPGSLEHSCITEGYADYLRIREKLNLPLLQCGALVLAWNEQEHERLFDIERDAARNGVDSVRMLTRDEALQREPGLAGGVVAAIEVAGEFVIDPWSAPHAYLLQALQNGARLERHCELLGGEFDGASWRLDTARGSVRGQRVINCAGLHGDRVDRSLLGESAFEIRPRKGQFVVFDKSAGQLTRRILLPVPIATTKGIVVCPTIFGNLLVGPTAEEQESRERADVDRATLHALVERGREILPALSRHAVTATYAGIRPATEHKDYQLRWYHDRHYCSVGGIRSTGLSAALGIAAMVYRGYTDAGVTHTPPPKPRWPQVPTLAEHGQRDWREAGNGGIVCHCERVTRREVERALQGPVAPGSLAELKRRTRVTMGRCQGFYCSAELAELTAGRIQPPMSEAIK